jgi:hypothetical protein
VLADRAEVGAALSSSGLDAGLTGVEPARVVREILA